MLRYLYFIRTTTSRNVIVNTAGNYINIGFATFYTIFLARVFDKVEFGILSVLLVFSYVLSNILSFGMPASIYAHLPMLAKNHEKSIAFLKSNIIVLTALVSASVCVLFLSSNFIDRYIFKLQVPPIYYGLALTGTFLYVIQNFLRDSLNAVGDFIHINIALNISNIVKSIVLVYLALNAQLTILNTLFILGVVGPLIVFAVALFERKWVVRAVIQSPIQREAIKFGYTLQYFISTQLFMLATRVDLFLVAFYLLPGDKGDYALAQRIVLAIVTTTDSITQVLSPQFSQVQNKKSIIELVKKSFKYMLLPTTLLILAGVTPDYIYTLLFTETYSYSTLITRILSVAYIPFSFAAIIALFFLYTIKKPIYVLVSNLLLLVLLFVGNFILIPVYNMLAPPLVALFAFSLISMFLLVCFGVEMRRMKR